MTFDEAGEIINLMAQLDVSKMDIQDQLIFLSAGAELAKKMKPLVVKYMNDLPENAKFIIKM